MSNLLRIRLYYNVILVGGIAFFAWVIFVINGSGLNFSFANPILKPVLTYLSTTFAYLGLAASLASVVYKRTILVPSIIAITALLLGVFISGYLKVAGIVLAAQMALLIPYAWYYYQFKNWSELLDIAQWLTWAALGVTVILCYPSLPSNLSSLSLYALLGALLLALVVMKWKWKLALITPVYLAVLFYSNSSILQLVGIDVLIAYWIISSLQNKSLLYAMSFTRLWSLRLIWASLIIALIAFIFSAFL